MRINKSKRQRKSSLGIGMLLFAALSTTVNAHCPWGSVSGGPMGCVDCGAGRFSNAGTNNNCVVCSGMQYGYCPLSRNENPTACPSGYCCTSTSAYAPGTVEYTEMCGSVSTGGNPPTQTAAPLTNAPETTTTTTQPTNPPSCAAGKMWHADTQSCQYCPAGTEEVGGFCEPCASGEMVVPGFARLTSDGQGGACHCPLGNFLVYNGAKNGRFCVLCPVGTYNDELGGECKSCGPKKTTDAMGSTSVSACHQDCAAWQYWHVGYCMDCPNGGATMSIGYSPALTWLPGYHYNQCYPLCHGEFHSVFVHDPHSSNYAEGSYYYSMTPNFDPSNPAVAGDPCILCPFGWISYDGTDCHQCPLGTHQENVDYSDPTVLANKAACYQCAAGTYGAVWDKINNTPSTSSKLTVSDFAYCAKCQAGHYCPGGPYYSAKCPAGTASSVEGAISESTCVTCAPGTYSGEAGSAHCTPCAPGYVANKYGSTTCTPAPAGSYTTDNIFLHYCPDGTYSSVKAATSASVCTPCPTGTFSSFEAFQKNYRLGGYSMSKCLPCPAATYSDEVGLTSASQCKSCPDGAIPFSSNAQFGGYQTCTQCQPGEFTFIDTDGIESCQLCPAGTYSEIASSECLLCPGGSYSAAIGASSESTCLECNAGWYSFDGESACSICFPGTWSFGGSSFCIPCDKGSFNPLIGASSPSECTPCSAGTYTAFEGAMVQGEDCLGCPRGSYCPIVGGTHTAILPCPHGSTTHGENATSISDCNVCIESMGYTLHTATPDDDKPAPSFTAFDDLPLLYTLSMLLSEANGHNSASSAISGNAPATGYIHHKDNHGESSPRAASSYLNRIQKKLDTLTTSASAAKGDKYFDRSGFYSSNVTKSQGSTVDPDYYLSTGIYETSDPYASVSNYFVGSRLMFSNAASRSSYDVLHKDLSVKNTFLNETLNPRVDFLTLAPGNLFDLASPDNSTDGWKLSKDQVLTYVLFKEFAWTGRGLWENMITAFGGLQSESRLAKIMTGQFSKLTEFCLQYSKSKATFLPNVTVADCFGSVLPYGIATGMQLSSTNKLAVCNTAGVDKSITGFLHYVLYQTAYIIDNAQYSISISEMIYGVSSSSVPLYRFYDDLIYFGLYEEYRNFAVCPGTTRVHTAQRYAESLIVSVFKGMAIPWVAPYIYDNRNHDTLNSLLNVVAMAVEGNSASPLVLLNKMFYKNKDDTSPLTISDQASFLYAYNDIASSLQHPGFASLKPSALHSPFSTVEPNSIALPVGNTFNTLKAAYTTIQSLLPPVMSATDRFSHNVNDNFASGFGIAMIEGLYAPGWTDITATSDQNENHVTSFSDAFDYVKQLCDESVDSRSAYRTRAQIAWATHHNSFPLVDICAGSGVGGAIANYAALMGHCKSVVTFGAPKFSYKAFHPTVSSNWKGLTSSLTGDHGVKRPTTIAASLATATAPYTSACRLDSPSHYTLQTFTRRSFINYDPFIPNSSPLSDGVFPSHHSEDNDEEAAALINDPISFLSGVASPAAANSVDGTTIIANGLNDNNIFVDQSWMHSQLKSDGEPRVGEWCIDGEEINYNGLDPLYLCNIGAYGSDCRQVTAPDGHHRACFTTTQAEWDAISLGRVLSPKIAKSLTYVDAYTVGTEASQRRRRRDRMLSENENLCKEECGRNAGWSYDFFDTLRGVDIARQGFITDVGAVSKTYGGGARGDRIANRVRGIDAACGVAYASCDIGYDSLRGNLYNEETTKAQDDVGTYAYSSFWVMCSVFDAFYADPKVHDAVSKRFETSTKYLRSVVEGVPASAAKFLEMLRAKPTLLTSEPPMPRNALNVRTVFNAVKNFGYDSIAYIKNTQQVQAAAAMMSRVGAAGASAASKGASAASKGASAALKGVGWVGDAINALGNTRPVKYFTDSRVALAGKALALTIQEAKYALRLTVGGIMSQAVCAATTLALTSEAGKAKDEHEKKRLEKMAGGAEMGCTVLMVVTSLLMGDTIGFILGIAIIFSQMVSQFIADHPHPQAGELYPKDEEHNRMLTDSATADDHLLAVPLVMFFSELHSNKISSKYGLYLHNIDFMERVDHLAFSNMLHPNFNHN